jgi:hypothetical protein
MLDQESGSSCALIRWQANNGDNDLLVEISVTSRTARDIMSLKPLEILLGWRDIPSHLAQGSLSIPFSHHLLQFFHDRDG